MKIRSFLTFAAATALAATGMVVAAGPASAATCMITNATSPMQSANPDWVDIASLGGTCTDNGDGTVTVVADLTLYDSVLKSNGDLRQANWSVSIGGTTKSLLGSLSLPQAGISLLNGDTTVRFTFTAIAATTLCDVGLYAFTTTDNPNAQIKKDELSTGATGGVCSPPVGNVTLTYDALGGTPTPTSVTVAAGSTVTVAAAPSKAGYTFAGWSTAADSSVEYAAGASLVLMTSMTLYAVWSPVGCVDCYTITPSGGSAPALWFDPGQQTGTYPYAISTVLKNTGGAATSYTWTCTANTGVTGTPASPSATLPTFSGTPTADGQCDVTATGPYGNASASFKYNVLYLAPIIAINPASQNLDPGASVSPVISATGGPVTKYTVECTPNTGVTGTPSGTATLPVISGKPTASGKCVVTATGPGGTSTATYSWTVKVAPTVACGSARVVSVTPGTASLTVAPSTATVSVSALGAGIGGAQVMPNAIWFFAKPGFSGNTTVKVTASNDGLTASCDAAVVVVPAPVVQPHYTPIRIDWTSVVWVASPNAVSYKVYANGDEVCSVTAPRCNVKAIYGPADDLLVKAVGNDGTESTLVPAEYWPDSFVQIGVVNFDENVSTFDAKARAQLKAIVAIITQHGFTKVLAAGNTDNQGGSNNAVPLSRARAKAVGAWIDAKVQPELTLVWYANNWPVATNATKWGQAKNRRTDVSVM